jgi:uncharacterized membrane protein YdjX (TVP38/TMEM64 family)
MVGSGIFHAYADLLISASLPKASHHLRLVLLVLFVLGLCVLGSSSVFHEFLSWLLPVVQAEAASHPLRGAVFFVLYAALGAMLAFVSSSVLVPVAIYAWGEEKAFFLLWMGWLVGGVASYGIGRFLGRPMLRWLASASQIEAYEQRIGNKAGLPLIFLFQLAMPSEIPGYVLGLLRYPLARYLAILAVAELPYAIGVIFLGDALMNGQVIRFALVALAGIALLAYALRHLHKLLEQTDRQINAPANAGVDEPPVS